jgi:hypothetical protein
MKSKITILVLLLFNINGYSQFLKNYSNALDRKGEIMLTAHSGLSFVPDFKYRYYSKSGDTTCSVSVNNPGWNFGFYAGFSTSKWMVPYMGFSFYNHTKNSLYKYDYENLNIFYTVLGSRFMLPTKSELDPYAIFSLEYCVTRCHISMTNITIWTGILECMVYRGHMVLASK